MNTVLRTVLTCALALAVATGTFAAGQQEKVKTASLEKPASITLMVDGTFLVKEAGESIIEKGFEDLTGIDLVINHPAHNEYYAKVDLAFATGDIPDVFLLGTRPFVNYVANGALFDMTDLYEKSSIKDRIVDPGLVESMKVDGRIYGLPYERGNGTVTYIRYDWLTKLGLKEPTTYDEFLNMLRQFKYNNPDGLAPEKVIPITAPGLINSEYPLDIYLREFYQDANPDYFKKNGKWVDGMLEPNMVAALKRLRDAYAEGLIDTEVITNKTSTCRDKFYSGTVGAFNYWAGTWNYNMQINIIKNVPQALVRPIKPIKGTWYIERPAVALVISAKAKNPEAIFKYFVEFALDGGPGQNLFTFGVEGTNYKKNADGLIEFLPSLQDPSKPFIKAWFNPDYPVTKGLPAYKKSELISSSLALFQANNKIYPLLPNSSVLSELTPEVNAIRGNVIAKIVYGEWTIEDGLKQYAASISKYNEAILKDLNS